MQMSRFSMLIQQVKRYCVMNGINHVGMQFPAHTEWYSRLLSSSGFQLCRCWLPYQLQKDTLLCINVLDQDWEPGSMTMDPEETYAAPAPSTPKNVQWQSAAAPTNRLTSTSSLTLTPTIDLPGPQVKKQYCTYWLSRGECHYKQQGCRYSHEIPQDRNTWHQLGFARIPEWLRQEGYVEGPSQRQIWGPPGRSGRKGRSPMAQGRSQLDSSRQGSSSGPGDRVYRGGGYGRGHEGQGLDYGSSPQSPSRRSSYHGQSGSSPSAGNDPADEFLQRNFPDSGFERRWIQAWRGLECLEIPNVVRPLEVRFTSKLSTSVRVKPLPWKQRLTSLQSLSLDIINELKARPAEAVETYLKKVFTRKSTVHDKDQALLWSSNLANRWRIKADKPRQSCSTSRSMIGTSRRILHGDPLSASNSRFPHPRRPWVLH